MLASRLLLAHSFRGKGLAQTHLNCCNLFWLSVGSEFGRFFLLYVFIFDVVTVSNLP